MSTWEQRMAQRSAARATVAEAERMLDGPGVGDDAAAFLAREERMVEFAGPCDVCGQEIRGRAIPGEVDYFLAAPDGSPACNNDGVLATWFYHHAGPLPDCARFASVVRDVRA